MSKHSAIPLPLTMGSLLQVGGHPLYLAIALAIGSAALSIVPMWVVYRIIIELDQASPDWLFIWLNVGGMTGALILRWALMAIAHVKAHTGAFRIQHQLKVAMAKRLGEVPMSFFSRRGSGSLRRTLIDDTNSLEGFFAHMLPDAIAAAVVPIVSITLLLVVDWRMGLSALIPLPLALFVQWWFMRQSAERMEAWSAIQKQIADQVSEYVRGIHLIKTFGLEARSFGDLQSAIQNAVNWVSDYARQSSIGWVMFTALLSSGLVIVAPLGAWLAVNGQITLATLVLFLLVSPSVLSPLLRLTFALGEQVQRQQALKRIEEILASKPLSDSEMQEHPWAVLDIQFTDVHQRYDERHALQGVSFLAKAGQFTAIVGASGSGKSTLLRLVARLYEFDSGQILVGGRDVREWPLDELLGKISIVFQDVFLFEGSVRDNLKMANPDASDVEIENAAIAARAHEFILALPQGYDTVLGERGARLSGGERQRLSIARALLKNAPILLLDEATASVDAENEGHIQQALLELCRERTVLMIAHRLHTIQRADQIIVLSDGRVKATGDHKTLLANSQAYQHLWRAHQRARHWTVKQQAPLEAKI